MITIGITICDKDYTNCQTLLEQIESRVSVEHEVIIIDNREKFLDEPTEWKATYTFGYNAYQFSARKKIIELAKGKYIWFVDGDDMIIRLDEFDFTEDVIAYNLYSNNKLELMKDKVYKKNICTMEMLETIKLPLWNKIIKKSLFDDLSDYTDCGFKAVSMEDTFYVLFALKNANTVRTCSNTTYYHKKGISDLTVLQSAEDFKKVVTGNKEMLVLLKNVLKDYSELFDKYFAHHRKYLYESIDAIQRCENAESQIGEVADALAGIIPEDILYAELFEKILSKATKKKYYDKMCSVFSDKFGEDFIKQKGVCTVTYFDAESGQMKNRQETYLKEIIFAEEELVWNHKLSIVCLVYDGNVKYLKSFTQMLDRVFVEHEIVIVDNRDDKTNPLDYDCKAVLVENEHNLGILEGRRKGFEKCTGDYVWFVDIDDEVYFITNTNYGDSDVIVFPFKTGENLCFPTTGTIDNFNYWKKETFWSISPFVWNKWFKKDLLEKMYEKLPSIDCVYYEDNLIYFTMIEFAKTIRVTDKINTTIYNHRANEDSITCKTITDTESIDRLFIGYKEALGFVEENYSDHKELLDYSLETGIIFYIEIMSRSDDSVKEYFADKIKKVFAEEHLENAINMIKKTIIWQEVEKYFLQGDE